MHDKLTKVIGEDKSKLLLLSINSVMTKYVLSRDSDKANEIFDLLRNLTQETLPELQKKVQDLENEQVIIKQDISIVKNSLIDNEKDYKRVLDDILKLKETDSTLLEDFNTLLSKDERTVSLIQTLRKQVKQQGNDIKNIAYNDVMKDIIEKIDKMPANLVNLMDEKLEVLRKELYKELTDNKEEIQKLFFIFDDFKKNGEITTEDVKTLTAQMEANNDFRKIINKKYKSLAGVVDAGKEFQTQIDKFQEHEKLVISLSENFEK